MKTNQIIIGVTLSMLFLSGCVTNMRKAENLYTFGKVYGYVRWFYPGDEAAQIDWNKFAVNGVQKVEKARSEKELRKILTELFNPIAPAIQISEINMDENYGINSIVSQDTSGLKPVSWKHFGVFLGDNHNLYNSIRINRDEPEEILPCLIHNVIDISGLHGKEIKLQFSAKSTENSNRRAYLCIALRERSGSEDYSIENFDRNSKWNRYSGNVYKDQGETIIVPDTCWGKYSRIINVGNDDNGLAFGIATDNLLNLFVGEFSLMVKEEGNWTPIKLINGDFEMGFNEWETHRLQYNISIDTIKSRNAKSHVKISSSNNNPQAGAFIKKDIGNDLTLLMPLVLYSNIEHTFPVADLSKLSTLKEQLEKIAASPLNKEDPSVRLANVIIAWNVFQHFYPYFDVIHVDWETELKKTLHEVLASKTEPEYLVSLKEMTAKLKDAHIIVGGANYVEYGMKVKVDLFDNDVVVTNSGSDQFQKGDIIKVIDGKNAMEEIREKENLISASPNVKRYRALFQFGSAISPNDAQVTLQRDNKVIKIKVPRVSGNNQYFQKFDNTNDVINYGDSIFYLKGKALDINPFLNILASAKGIIIGSTDQLWSLIPHMIKEPVWVETGQYYIPLNTYPDREKTSWVQPSGMGMIIVPEPPLITSNCAIITSPFDQSHLEANLGIFDYLRLGVRVGDTTAGCNGAVNYIQLIGGYSIRWTGMKFLKTDGSQFHLIGFNPDYPVIRTKEAVLQGRDEHLEKAMEILKQN